MGNQCERGHENLSHKPDNITKCEVSIPALIDQRTGTVRAWPVSFDSQSKQELSQSKHSPVMNHLMVYHDRIFIMLKFAKQKSLKRKSFLFSRFVLAAFSPAVQHV